MKISNLRDLYNEIPKQEPQQVVRPVNTELVDKSVDKLNKHTQFIPEVGGKK